MSDVTSLPNLLHKEQRARWLASLPLAHRAELEKILLQTIGALSTAIIPPHERFISVETLAEPLVSISEDIKRQLHCANFPASTKFLKRLENFKELLSHMAEAYIVTLNSLAAHGYDGRESTYFTLSIFRAIQLNLAQQYLAYLSYRQPEARTWDKINKLYQLAYAKRIHLESVTGGMLDLVKAENIEHLYKQALLLNLAHPYQFSNIFTSKLASTLNYWAQFCHIYNAETHASHSGVFAINLNQPLPPQLAKNCDFSMGDIHIIDTSSLLLRFRQIISNPGMQLLPDCVKDLLNQHPFACIKRVYKSWGKLAKRMYTRRPAHTEIYLTVGFHGVHGLLSDKQNRSFSVFHSKVISSFDDSGTIPFMLNLEEVVHSDSIMHKQLGYKTSSETISIEAPDRTVRKAKVIDESAGGYCIELPKSSSQTICIGDLVCCHYSLEDQNTFTLCVVRWMKEDNNGFIFGIEVISPFAEATMICESSRRNEASAQIPALLLPQIVSLKLKATLLTAKSAILDTSKQYVLKSRAEKQIISLETLIESTSTFSRFNFDMEMGVIKQPLI